MIRRFTISLCIAAMLLAACVEPLAPGLRGRGIELTLVCDEPVETKAGSNGTEPGVDKYNENLISWVDFFFYSGEAPGLTTPAILHVYAPAGSRYEHIFHLNVTTSIFDASGKCTVFALANYPDSEEGSAFETDGNKTLQDLYALTVSTDFVSPENHKQPRFLMSGTKVLTKPETGVYLETMNIQRYAAKMTVAVKVDDVTIGEGEDAVTWQPMLEGMEIYLVDGVKRVSLGGVLESPADADYFSYSKNRKRFVKKNLDESLELLVPPKSGDYYNTYPMYMYPQHWIYGSTDAPEKEPYLKLVVPWYNGKTQRQCYYKVVLPEDSRSEYKQRFARNNWYHVAIDVGFLGADTDDEAVEIGGFCLVIQWQNKDLVMKQAEIGRARYLAVERNSLVLRNVSDAVSIPYYTSHPVTILSNSIRVTRPYYGTVAVGKSAMGGTVISSDGGKTKEVSYNETQRKNKNIIDGVKKEWWTNTGSSIEFQHILDNTMSSSGDYTPLHIELTLAHQHDPTNEDYQRTIVIEQYPAIYIDRITNSDSSTPSIYTADNTFDQPHSDYWGYVFVDGGAYWPNNNDNYNVDEFQYCIWQPGARQYRRDINRGTPKEDPFAKLTDVVQRREYQWRAVWYTGGSLDMFGINVSSLPAGSEFVIGDPRSDEIDNLDYEFLAGYPEGADLEEKKAKKLPSRSGFANAPALYDGETDRTLSYYYPTVESDNTKYVLAPSYRISSKFNGTEFANMGSLPSSGLLKNYARYRCATYQEDGFPAGRWRLPTYAEIKFIAQLSATGAFATLFNNGKQYWSANGVVKIGNTVDIVEQDNAMLRCVYDTWYWGKDQSEYDKWRMETKTEWKEGLDDEQIKKEKRNQFVWGDRPR